MCVGSTVIPNTVYWWHPVQGNSLGQSVPRLPTLSVSVAAIGIVNELWCSLGLEPEEGISSRT